MVLPMRTTDLVGPGYCHPPHTGSYSPSPHVPTEVQPILRPVHVVAPTPVNLVIQTNFTRVEHNYHYPSQESDTSSGYGSTPPPTTASSTRSSFSFSSTNSPTSPFDQTQEHTTSRTSQSHPDIYGSYPLRHRYDAADGHCYQQSSLTEHGTSPYHSPPDGRVYQHGAYYPRGDRQYPGDYESTDRDCGYESEPESDGGWVNRPIPGYGFYTTPNHTTEMWRHSSWFHPGVAKSGGDGIGSGGATDDSTNGLGSVEGYSVRGC